MPRRTVWCRHSGCGYAVEISEGKFPVFCSACGRAGKWSVEPIIDPDREIEPVEYALSPQDKRLLWLFYISQD